MTKEEIIKALEYASPKETAKLLKLLAKLEF